MRLFFDNFAFMQAGPIVHPCGEMIHKKGRSGLPGLFTGTSGWSYQHWSGVFYPAEIKPSDYLEFYITRFDCVELNSSFYHLPRTGTVEGWIRRTPDTFRFCVKLSRFITHRKKLMDCEEALERFFEVFGILQPRMGPVLIQLPPGLSYDEPLISDFLALLRSRYGSYRFAVEIRHKSWITDSFFDLLRQSGIAFVIADSGKRFPYHEAITSDFVYMRFHGAEQLYASDYDESRLRRYAEKIGDWLSGDREVWVFFNNDFNGFAVKNALRLREILHSTE